MPSNIIKFVHDNKIIAIKNPDPNETVLNYIRTTLKKTGTKEGCAEGGCGACTIVLGNLEKNKIVYSAINACIMFLPTLHGKQLIVVEDLVTNEGTLHPVQQAMVDYHSSQCGFCTPGFVMSLFSMYKNYSSFDEKIIKNSIAGNLCRCTGYQPIIKAGKSLNKKNKTDHFVTNSKKTISLLKKINGMGSIEISYRNKRYFAPHKVYELAHILKRNTGTEILSGGTDLSLIVTKERKDIKSIVYINSIDELNYITKNKKYIEVGATTPLIKFESFIENYYPDFNQILKRYGSVQIRNVATIAGNIATASPIGDTLPLLLALDTKIVLSNLKRKKTLLLNKFFTNYRKTKLKKGEFIESIKIPLPQGNIFKAYKISKRIDDDISTVCASFSLKVINKKIKNIRIAYGGMAATPKRAIYCEKTLLNALLTKKNFNKAAKSLEKDFSPISDVRGSAEYRVKLAKNLLFKCFLEIKNKNTIRVYE